jgi:hypothetical protein
MAHVVHVQVAQTGFQAGVLPCGVIHRLDRFPAALFVRGAGVYELSE